MRPPPLFQSLLRQPRRPIQLRGVARPRNSSTFSPPPPPQSSAKLSRAEKILSRLPRPLQKYTTSLRSAPTTHVVAFLILHEITAIVPLVGLVGVFHYGNWLPVGWLGESETVKEGVGIFERYARRKGWLEEGKGGSEGDEGEKGGIMEHWRENGRYKLVMEVGVAWALCKFLLPVRIGVSLWGTPWLARGIGRWGGVFKRGG
ncbi:uncharacterized protein QC763_209025 [Podospora pseudopauciseta]|uniref:Uncharacterized protein n=1 Tax=Podospora pseudopauciseta TaxID=2093780 RepID=A0ABR0HPV2_9PEZI|nr:hypothetical protein QC763_209025 [Podospora pseudopauciseta]